MGCSVGLTGPFLSMVSLYNSLTTFYGLFIFPIILGSQDTLLLNRLKMSRDMKIEESLGIWLGTKVNIRVELFLYHFHIVSMF